MSTTAYRPVTGNMVKKTAYRIFSQSPEKLEKLFHFFQDMNCKPSRRKTNVTKHHLKIEKKIIQVLVEIHRDWNFFLGFSMEDSDNLKTVNLVKLSTQ